MRFGSFYSRSCRGLNAVCVKVEACISPGLPSIRTVGLPETAVRESCHRVRAAICSSGYCFPSGRITINLAPADLPKEGSRFDLPIALGILTASRQLPYSELSEQFEFAGELSLSGKILPVRGIIASIISARNSGRGLLVPEANAVEAGLIKPRNLMIACDLESVCLWLQSRQKLQPVVQVKIQEDPSLHHDSMDFMDVHGQLLAVRALEVAIAGGHNCIFLGAPGSGKTMIASRAPTVMTPLSEQEAREVAMIRSLSGLHISAASIYQRPFRAPHHTASTASLVGGGSNPRPGEISQAHNGVLFLDELPEFSRQSLDALREPVEKGEIHLSRVHSSVTYPARFQLLAAMNPCPNGEDVDECGNCPCSTQQLRSYYRRVSAAMLDRIDMQVRVAKIAWKELEQSKKNRKSSQNMKKNIILAQRLQHQRQSTLNSRISRHQFTRICRLNKKDEVFILRCMEKMDLSARALTSILKVARTISDLAGSEHIERTHLLEAIGYRSLTKLFKANH